MAGQLILPHMGHAHSLWAWSFVFYAITSSSVSYQPSFLSDVITNCFYGLLTIDSYNE